MQHLGKAESSLFTNTGAVSENTGAVSVAEPNNSFDTVSDEVLELILGFTFLAGTNPSLVCSRFNEVSKSASVINTHFDNGESFLKMLDAGLISHAHFKKNVEYALKQIESTEEVTEAKGKELLQELLTRSIGFSLEQNPEEAAFVNDIELIFHADHYNNRIHKAKNIFGSIKKMIEPNQAHEIPIRTRKFLASTAIVTSLSNGWRVDNKIKQLVNLHNPQNPVCFIDWALKNDLEKLAITTIENANMKETHFLVIAELFRNNGANVKFIQANSPYNIQFDKYNVKIGYLNCTSCKSCEFLTTFKATEVATDEVATNHVKNLFALLLIVALVVAINRVAAHYLN